MTQQSTQTARVVHEHPIQWDAERQLWVCSRGCGFTRPKREGEVVPTREEALAEAQRAGRGLDYVDERRPARRAAERPAVQGPGDEDVEQPSPWRAPE